MFKWVDFCCLWGYICKLLFNSGKGKENEASAQPAIRAGQGVKLNQA
jgi:hypothetical protein